MLYFFISKMLGVDYSLRVSTPTFIIEPEKIRWVSGIHRIFCESMLPPPEADDQAEERQQPEADVD